MHWKGGVAGVLERVGGSSQLVSACGSSPMSSLKEPEPSMLAGVNLYRMYPVSRKLCHCTVGI